MPGRPLPPALDELTDRERQVEALVAARLTTAETADRLVISPATAKTHVGRAMFELGTHHRSQLAVIADEEGWFGRGAAPSVAKDRWPWKIS